MKKGPLTLLLLLLVPLIDGCINCKCEESEFNYDYSAIEFYQLTNFPVPLNETLSIDVLPTVEIIAEYHSTSISGAALMACSCISYYYPVYAIDKVEVISQPSFFNPQEASSVIDAIVEVAYYDETQVYVINLGENPSPQFSVADGPYFTARILERPNESDSTYAFTFKITKSNGDVVMNTLENVKWE